MYLYIYITHSSHEMHIYIYTYYRCNSIHYPFMIWMIIPNYILHILSTEPIDPYKSSIIYNLSIFVAHYPYHLSISSIPLSKNGGDIVGRLYIIYLSKKIFIYHIFSIYIISISTNGRFFTTKNGPFR